MLALVLCLASLAEPAPRVVGERVPMVVVVIAPGRGRAHLPVSEVLDAAVRAIEPKTGLRVLSAEQAGADSVAFVRCPPAERLSCWLRAARAEGRRAGESTPAAGGVRFVLVISVLSREGEPDRLSAQLLDVDAALDAIRGARDPDEAEDLIQIHAVHSTAASAIVPGVDQLDRWLEALVEDTLRGPLAAHGQWEPFGAIRLITDRPLVAELDGRAIGPVEAGETALAEVRAGSRTLLVRDPSRADDDPAASAAYTLDVTAGAEARLVVVMPSALGPVTRSASLWGGVITAALGTGLVVWALAASPSARAITPCTGADCEGSRPALWDDTCTLTSDDPSTCGDARGLRVAPFGGALALAGTTWALGSGLGDPEDVPWIVWIAGAAAGALAYGIATAAE